MYARMHKHHKKAKNNETQTSAHPRTFDTFEPDVLCMQYGNPRGDPSIVLRFVHVENMPAVIWSREPYCVLLHVLHSPEHFTSCCPRERSNDLQQQHNFATEIDNASILAHGSYTANKKIPKADHHHTTISSSTLKHQTCMYPMLALTTEKVRAELLPASVHDAAVTLCPSEHPRLPPSGSPSPSSPSPGSSPGLLGGGGGALAQNACPGRLSHDRFLSLRLPIKQNCTYAGWARITNVRVLDARHEQVPAHMRPRQGCVQPVGARTMESMMVTSKRQTTGCLFQLWLYLSCSLTVGSSCARSLPSVCRSMCVGVKTAVFCSVHDNINIQHQENAARPALAAFNTQQLSPYTYVQRYRSIRVWGPKRRSTQSQLRSEFAHGSV